MHWGIVSEFESAKPGRDATRVAPTNSIRSLNWEAAKTFNPTNYDPDKWMAELPRGLSLFRYQHQAPRWLALWTDTLNWRGWPCLITPFVEACRNNDVKVGFYYPDDWQDRNHMNFASRHER